MSQKLSLRSKIIRYIIFPVYIVVVFVLAAIVFDCFVEGFMATQDEARKEAAYYGLIAGVILSFLVIAPLAVKRTNSPKDSKTKPLVCSCGKDKRAVYAFPGLGPLWGVAMIGVALASLLAFLVYPQVDMFVVIIFFVIVHVVIFIFCFGDFLMAGHTLRCSARRGFMNAWYALVTIKMSSTAYEDKNKQ